MRRSILIFEQQQFAPSGDGSLLKRANSTAPPDAQTAAANGLLDTNQSLQGFFRCVTSLDHVMQQVGQQLQSSQSPASDVVKDPRVKQIMNGKYSKANAVPQNVVCNYR